MFSNSVRLMAKLSQMLLNEPCNSLIFANDIPTNGQLVFISPVPLFAWMFFTSVRLCKFNSWDFLIQIFIILQNVGQLILDSECPLYPYEFHSGSAKAQVGLPQYGKFNLEEDSLINELNFCY
jgi:hypothetical protein